MDLHTSHLRQLQSLQQQALLMELLPQDNTYHPTLQLQPHLGLLVLQPPLLRDPAPLPRDPDLLAPPTPGIMVLIIMDEELPHQQPHLNKHKPHW